MQITLDVGVQRPQEVDAALTVFPHGQVQVKVHKGGLDVPRPDGKGLPTVMANVAICR